jgi:transposase-like protein
MVGWYAVDHLGNLKHICAMEYESQDKPIRTDVGSRHTGAKVPPEKRADIVKRLKEGEGIVAIAKTVGSSEHTVTAIRNDLGGGLELNAWKKSHRNNLMQAAAKMGARLVNEVDITNDGWPVAHPRFTKRPSAKR